MSQHVRFFSPWPEVIIVTLNPRQERILQTIQREGFATIDALAGQFAVTVQTIRRDINTLCGLGLLRRYHGGAGLPSTTHNIAYSTRRALHLEAKIAIAQAVAAYVPQGSSLFLNLGTTVEQVAVALKRHRNLRIITNNLHVADILCDAPNAEVIITGGVVRARDRGITSQTTIDQIRQFSVDYAVIGISGIHRDGTLLEYDFHEVRVTQAILEGARQRILVADYSKFHRNALVRLGHLRQIHLLFTDAPPPADLGEALTQSEVELRVAPP